MTVEGHGVWDGIQVHCGKSTVVEADNTMLNGMILHAFPSLLC